MGHHHHDTKNIKAAFFLNLTFTIIEVIGGLYTNSIAILSDALHDLGDSLSLGLSWYFQKLSKKGRTQKYSYGYGRFSVLGAVINTIVLVTGSVIIIYEAIPRLLDPKSPDTEGMIYLAILGIIFNGAAILKLKRGESINEKVVTLHLLEDVLGWVAVLIGALVMHFYDLPIVDPILSLLIAFFILYNVYRNLSVSLRIMLQGTPQELNINQIVSELKNISSINNIHDCHLWSLYGDKYIFSTHLVVDDKYQMDDLSKIKKEVRERLKKHGINHATLEFETESEECKLEDC